MAGLTARALTVRYDKVRALDAIDLDVASGEIFVLLGGSGSGKTTLLRCLGGFVAAEEGTITLGGRDIGRLPPHLRPVNTMFQSYALFPHLDVARNVGFGLNALARPERRARVAELLSLVRLDGFGARRVSALSGGQQQRVALARSLAPRPDLLLLDEPFSALDRGLREETRAETIALLRSLGTTAILVTHDQDEALATADRIGLLRAGRMVQVGTPADLYERPASRYAATFLGAANILEGDVLAADEGCVGVRVAGQVIRVPGAGAPAVRAAVAVRPERLRLCDPSKAGDRERRPDDGPHASNVLSGTLIATTYRGPVLDIDLRLSDGASVRATCPSDGAEAHALVRGAPASITWKVLAGVLLND